MPVVYERLSAGKHMLAAVVAGGCAGGLLRWLRGAMLDWALEPAVVALLRTGARPPTVRRLTAQAAALPVLSPAAVALLLRVVERARRPGGGHGLAKWTIDPEDQLGCPRAAGLGRLLAHAVLPALAELVLPGPRAMLCPVKWVYMLDYQRAEEHPGGRVFKLHVDDADLTLAVCLGRAGGWRGADLEYVHPRPDLPGERPGTPDPDDPAERLVEHAHRPGEAVVHGGGAYHRVTSLESGRRATLVAFAMRDDAAWKRQFYHRLLAGEV